MRGQLRIGLIGTGFIGRPHALSVRAVNAVFPECRIIASQNAQPDSAQAARISRLCAAALDSSSTGKWALKLEGASLTTGEDS